MTVSLPAGAVQVQIDQSAIEGAIAKAATQVAGGRLVDTKQAAAMLGCSSKHVRNLVDRGEFLPPIRIGNLLRWRATDIDSWLAKQATAGAA